MVGADNRIFISNSEHLFLDKVYLLVVTRVFEQVDFLQSVTWRSQIPGLRARQPLSFAAAENGNHLHYTHTRTQFLYTLFGVGVTGTTSPTFALANSNWAAISSNLF